MCPLPQPRSQIDFTPSSRFTSSTNTRVSFSPDSPLAACSACHSNSLYVGAAIQDVLVELDQMLRDILPRVLARQFLPGATASREFCFIAHIFRELCRQCVFVDWYDPTGIRRHDFGREVNTGT